MTPSSQVNKTCASVGILIVGIGGNNGTTLVAGLIANQRQISWFGPQGQPRTPNYIGCITQIPSRGKYGGVGFSDVFPGLASMKDTAVGGWDIRPTLLGDALLQQQILDYDLVRQVREEMNSSYKVYKGYYDPQFIGSRLREDATHILTLDDVPDTTRTNTAIDIVNLIREDIRYFKWTHGIVGHTAVIWSASVEPNCEFCVPGNGLDTAQELLASLQLTRKERGGGLPPSLLYAIAAVLEGCSFVNGGSQNTISCNGLVELAQAKIGVYCLGTDFKAGQTKFKTAAVEYIRTMGLTPKVIASSNHLGNNDMKNLECSDKTLMAKLRVKHDIFAAWEEDIDHKVSVMYTPYINDEKRDFVEYTSEAFLGQHHTMVTYTRAMDSVLCVPLMIDAAIWCDYFSKRCWPFAAVAKALAYLFKVPEGAAKDVDPGFFRQMEELKIQASAASGADRSSILTPAAKNANAPNAPNSSCRSSSNASLNSDWSIPSDVSIVCAGLACVDMELNDATGGSGGEAIETFKGVTYICGGSVSMACKTLARLCYGSSVEGGAAQPILSSIFPLCKVGSDDAGHKLIDLLKQTGIISGNVDTTLIAAARDRDPSARTAMSVLPIYQSGARGCFFDAASCETFSSNEIAEMLMEISVRKSSEVSAFIFGYPHLLPSVRGENLAQAFADARGLMSRKGSLGGITVLDLNGVPPLNVGPHRQRRNVADLMADPVLGAALPDVDILHLNEQELADITGFNLVGTDCSVAEHESEIASAVALFNEAGVAIVALTRGKNGCLVRCGNADRFLKSPALPKLWVECMVKANAWELPKDVIVNSNGAGDAFTAGFLVAALLRKSSVVSSNTFKAVSPSQKKQAQKMTAYTLYLSEKYASLKSQCNDD